MMPPQPQTTSTVAGVLSEPKIEKSTVFASILNSVLITSLASPNLLISYLTEHNGQLFSIGFQTLEDVSLLQTSEKMSMLSYLLSTFPITPNEFPAFMQLSVCKLDLKHLPMDEQIKIRTLQNNSLSNIENFHPFGNRLIELSNISQHFLNIFYIFC